MSISNDFLLFSIHLLLILVFELLWKSVSQKSRTTNHLLRQRYLPMKHQYLSACSPPILPKCKAPKSFILSSTLSLAWLQPFLHCTVRMSSWNSTVTLRCLLKIPLPSGLSPNILTQFTSLIMIWASPHFLAPLPTMPLLGSTHHPVWTTLRIPGPTCVPGNGNTEDEQDK